DSLRSSLAAFYAGSPIVLVLESGNPRELVLDRDAAPWDGMELFVFGNEGGWNARLVARLDNLGKGASGAAIQNLNLMCGLPETTGLSL
ncbi:MAG: N-acetyl-gamma-glutamyl-phosphate reductase, partial [Pseudomonadota bacterium]|nr:N-acetyl-gamma-glutamyl-phosphate reductase [Pseudomonadota bacterium]